MSKIVIRTGMLSGAISGLGTLVLVDLFHVVRAYHDNIFYFFIVFIGNLIIYSLLAILGGAIAGIVLGMFGAFIVRLISRGKTELRIGAIYGGILGGIPLGLAPLWLGFGYLY